MRLLVVYKFYWPDVGPYGPILKEIVEHLVRDGHTATVLTAQPSYNNVSSERRPARETMGGVQIVRVPLLPERKSWAVVRLVNFLLFLAWAFWYALLRFRQFDLLLFNSTPAVLMGLWGQIVKACTGIPYLYHCQDLHPESAAVVGQLKNQRLIRLMRRIDTRSCRQAKLAIVLSQDMRRTLLERGVPDERIGVISNFSVRSPNPSEANLPVPFDQNRGKFRLLFAGNLGNFQALDEMIEVALRLRDHPEIQWVFMGEGSAKARLQSRAEPLLNRTVFFVPHQPADVAFACLRRAEMGLVSLAPEIYKSAFPTKTLMYCDAGCPILAVIEPDSDLAVIVREEQIGYDCPQGDPDRLAATVLQASREHRQWTPERREQIREVGQRLFGREAVLQRWSQMLGGEEQSQAGAVRRPAA